jgi:ribosomal protein S18 acetylase RimI-like enzyme
MRIRPAQPHDATGITRVQVPSWQAAYKGIVPDTYLQNMLTNEWQQHRIDHWTRTITSGEIFGVVAENEQGELIGFAMGGNSRDPGLKDYDGELYAIYILPTLQRQGLGKALLQAFARDLYERGYSGMLIWALRDNTRARGFYEKMGGQSVGKKLVTLGEPLWEVGYGWPDLGLLTASFNREAR